MKPCPFRPRRIFTFSGSSGRLLIVGGLDPILDKVLDLLALLRRQNRGNRIELTLTKLAAPGPLGLVFLSKAGVGFLDLFLLLGGGVKLVGNGVESLG